MLRSVTPDASESRDASSPGPVTALLREAAEGGQDARAKLMSAVYDELKHLAEAQMRGEHPGHTLQPTALVHETWLRLSRQEDVPWRCRAQFFHAAASAMRRILIDHARSRKAVKRGDGRAALEIESVGAALAHDDGASLLVLDEAMEQLAQVHAEAAELVRLKFYVGLDSAATALVLGISERSARREWAFARGWLRDRLERVAHGERA